MSSIAIQQGAVEVDFRGSVAIVQFSHPLSNSLPSTLLSKLATTITELGSNDEVNVIVLRSGGTRAFCAGASFDELMAIEDIEMGKHFFMGFANVINAARKCPKIIIGRVQGKAVGGGIGMASAVDYCFASKYASVKLSELAVGIGPFVVGPAVERKIGISAMSQLSINATQWKDASWAREKGLYAEVFDTIEEMDNAIEKLAIQLSSSNPEAMALLKKVFWEGTENWDHLLAQRAEMSGRLVLSDYSKNAIKKFKSKE